MTEKRLFPVFDVPEITTPTQAEERKYKPSPYFDFETGDFKRSGSNKIIEADGKEAYRQWCLKVVLTERLDHLSYDSDIGAELNDALKQADRAAVESALERTITEALMVDRRTEYVRRFEFEWKNSALYCTFRVKGEEWEEQEIGVNFNT